MKSTRSAFLLGIVSAAIWSVAAPAEMRHTPPANVTLAGLWRINPDLSDDAERAVQKKRQASDPGGGGPVGGSAGTRGGGIVIDAGEILGGIFGGGSSGSGTGGRTSGGGTGGRPAEDPEPSLMRVPLDSFLATLEEFEIAQEPDSLTIATVDEKTTCKPADPGQAPVPGGELGDRKCGWRGSTWVTEITAPDGVIRTNRYELKKDGRQLVMTSEIKGRKTELSGLRIKRVYDRVL